MNNKFTGSIDGKSLLKTDQILNNTIHIDANGDFPKKLIIHGSDNRLEYRLLKSKNGRYQLNK